MPDRALLIALLVFALVFQTVWLFSTTPERESDVIGRRLATGGLRPWEAAAYPTFSVMRRRRYSRLPWLDALLERFDLADGLGQQLIRTGLPLRGGEFVFIQIVAATVGALFGVLLGLVVQTPPLLWIVTAFIFFLAPLAWLRVLVARRLSEFEVGLVDALDRIAASLRAGYGLEHGLNAVTRYTEGPCAEEFGEVLQEINLGGDIDEALTRMTVRVRSEDAILLATAVSVQRRTGGNLVEVLSQMSQVIRERQRLRREVRVMTTAPRVSGYVVALLPLICLIALFFVARYYVDTLLSDPVGRLAALVGLVLVLLGLFLNNRIAQIEY